MRTGRQRPKRAKLAVADRNHTNLVFECAIAMEEPLSNAAAYGSALELIGFGLKRIDKSHGQAVLAIAEAMAAELASVQKCWRHMIATTSDVQRASTRQPRA